MFKYIAIIIAFVNFVYANPVGSFECDSDSLLEVINTQNKLIDSLKTRINDPVNLYGNLYSEITNDGYYKTISEKVNNLKDSEQIPSIVALLEKYKAGLAKITNYSIGNVELSKKVSALSSEIDLELGKLIKRKGQKDAVTFSGYIEYDPKDNETRFADRVKLILTIKNNTNETIVATKLKVTIVNMLKKNQLNDVFETDWTVDPFSSSDGGICWSFEDNPFLNGEVFDRLFSLARSGNYKIDISPVTIVYK